MSFDEKKKHGSMEAAFEAGKAMNDDTGLEREYDLHHCYKRNCVYLDRSNSSDWVTCKHRDNLTVLEVCSPEHCPKRGEWLCCI